MRLIFLPKVDLLSHRSPISTEILYPMASFQSTII